MSGRTERIVSNLEQTQSLPESRDRETRRQLSWRTVFYGFIRSRRRHTRRGDEGEPLYTDWHHPWLFFLATGTMLLSCKDAVFTLQLLDRGAVEINPIMALVISKSTLTFAATMLLLSGLGFLMLVFLSRW